jgi:hypothetical protein
VAVVGDEERIARQMNFDQVLKHVEVQELWIAPRTGEHVKPFSLFAGHVTDFLISSRV